MHNHRCEGYRSKIYRGRSNTGNNKNVKTVHISKKSKKRKDSNPSGKIRLIFQFDPWWLKSVYLFKTKSVPLSVPISIGLGDSVKIGGGATP